MGSDILVGMLQIWIIPGHLVLAQDALGRVVILVGSASDRQVGSVRLVRSIWVWAILCKHRMLAGCLSVWKPRYPLAPMKKLPQWAVWWAWWCVRSGG